MPQQYPTMTNETMYTDFKQSSVPSPYQENYPIVYSHANFQHYRSTMPLSSGYDFGYDYGQQYYSSQPSNSYGMLPSYHNSVTNNAFTPYNPPNFHGSSLYPTYENLSVPAANNLLNIKTELGSEPNESIGVKSFVENSKTSPIENSDRSECSYSSKLEICSKASKLMDNSSTEHAEITFSKDENTSSE